MALNANAATRIISECEDLLGRVLPQSPVSQLAHGNVIRFPNGDSFTGRRILSHQGTDVIVELEDETVLRLNKGLGETIDSYLRGSSDLIREQVSTPQILNFLKGYYVRVAKERIDMSFRTFVAQYFCLDDETREKMLARFVEFIKSFKHFNYVGDFSDAQFAYSNQKGWILLDWRDSHIMGTQYNPFWPVFDHVKDLPGINLEALSLLERRSNDSLIDVRNLERNHFSRMNREDRRRYYVFVWDSLGKERK